MVTWGKTDIVKIILFQKTSYKVEKDVMMNWITERSSLQMGRNFHTCKKVSGLEMSKRGN